jgi:23S rRNA-/tRNA-specific pseudouridylate synthase
MNLTRGNSSPLDATLLQATLHAEELGLAHPVTGEVLTITAP